MIKQAQDTVDLITKNYKRGLITEEERYKEVVDTWKKTDDELTHALLSGLDKYNNIFMMADSGARGSDKQIKQLAGMRGLMADTTGHTIELPIKSNFHETFYIHTGNLCSVLTAVHLTYDQILRYVNKTSCQVTGIGCTKSGIRKSFTSSMSGHEIFQYVQTLTEV